MNRKVYATILTAGALALAAGCGTVQGSGGGGGGGGGGGQDGPIRLAVVPKAIGFDFWEQVRVGAECAAERAEGDVQVQWDGVTAETDVTGQADLLTNFTTQGVDGLVYAATDARVLANVTQSALDQGLTVVNIDSGTDPQPPEVPVYATDNVAAAEQATELMVEELGEEGGKIAFIPFQPGTATNDTRTEGFKNVLEQNPQLELVAEQSSESDYNTALQVTTDILTANPDLRGIYAANEPGVLGAAEAVRQAGLEGEVTIVGWDTAPDEIKAVEEGVVTALVAQNPFRMGFDGVNAAVGAIREGAAPESGDTGATLVTQENLNDEEVQAVLQPSCENPPTGG
ncbi:substrate-binding domain-containing protein [Rubrobacter marinus]|uniref:Substrate-binding domain-containing protein n=1 Tax=Rubrobacter marinus TaxID=2653852 RepID=A0A6G8PZG4_9ACTN|nr:substrate-binding domain-containing protein [Rubrobacter marinus]QIN79558.1 substrate-binding domain-containing protein [Rubrobacter marinus]